MDIRRVRDEKTDIHRYVEDAWLPYHEELSESIDPHALEDGVDRQGVVELLHDRLDSPDTRLWVAIDGIDDHTAPVSSCGGTIAGFVTTALSPKPPELDWPDRVEISDLWVKDTYRGSGLAMDLGERALQQAREDGCTELTVDVSVDNERAIAFFERLGFEIHSYRMHVPLEDVELEESADNVLSDGTTHPQFRRLRIDEDVMNRFFEECWLPFWRDLGEAVGADYLDTDIDRSVVVETLLDSYDVPDRRCWVVLDEGETTTAGLEAVDSVFAGWLNAGLEPTAKYLDPPERLFVGNLYVKPSYRGSGLADSLLRRGLQYAREEGVAELVLGVEADNGRAMAYYEKLGFEPLRQGMSVPVDQVDL